MQRFVRLFTVTFLVLVVLVGPRAGTLARQATDNPFADLGLPELAVTITDTAFETDTTDLDAGRYVVAVTNDSGSEDIGVNFLAPPDDMTAQELVDFITGDPEAGASPSANGGSDEGSAPPPFYYDIPIAGGAYAPVGETVYVVVDLAAGDWLLWGDDPAAAQPPVILTVTGEMPADLPEPEADVTITGKEMAFDVDGTLAAGPQIIAFHNAGEQPHFLLMLGVPDGTTVDDFMALLSGPENPSATPTEGGLSFEEVTAGLETATQSSGTTTWIAADLDPGTYVLACFIPDKDTGAPHVMLGMVDVVVVE